MSTKWQRFTLNLDKNYKPNERVAIAWEVLEFIRKRTARGEDKNNRDFKPYSKPYPHSLDFRNAGKTEKNVNLTLSGDMLGAMKLLNEAPGKVVIGFENGTQENAKADGNIRGTYGRSSPHPSVARDFLGIAEDDLKRILKRFPPGSEKTKEYAAKLAKTNDEVIGILEELSGE